MERHAEPLFPGRIHIGEGDSNLQPLFFLSINQSNNIYTVFDGLEGQTPLADETDGEERRLVTFKEFQTTLNTILKEQGPALTLDAKEKFRAEIRLAMQAQLN